MFYLARLLSTLSEAHLLAERFEEARPLAERALEYCPFHQDTRF